MYYRAVMDYNVVSQSADAVITAALRAICEGAGTQCATLQKHLLHCVVAHIGTRMPALARAAVVVLKNLYDSDVLGEDVVLAWAADDSDTSHGAVDVKRHAAPFVHWLQTADEDGGSDD